MGFIERFSQKALNYLSCAKEEEFEGFEIKKSVKSASELVMMGVLMIIYIAAIVFIGQHLWDNYLAGAGSGKGVVTVFKPLKDMPQALLVFLSLWFFFGSA